LKAVVGILLPSPPESFWIKIGADASEIARPICRQSTGLPDLMFASDNFLASWRSKVRNTLKCGSMAKPNFNIGFANLMLATTIVGLVNLAISASHAEPMDNWVQDYVVQFLCCGEPNPGGAGVYLGNGLVITAAHVAGGKTSGVRIDGLNVPAALIKTGSFPELDLSLIYMDPGKIPDSVRERRMMLCQEQPPAGTPVILAAPQGITRTSIASPTLIPFEFRTKFSTLISEGSTDGKSGSGVFDAEKKCLLGILSLKFTNNMDHKDIASYFVPADSIQSFIPVGSEMAKLQASVAPKLAEQSLPSLIVTPSSSIEFSGPQGGPFSPSNIEYRLSASSSTVGYSIRTPAWLTASSTSGTTDTNGITITLTVNANASSLSQGTYGPAVGFTNVSNGRGSTSRLAKLTVQGPSLPHPAPQVERIPPVPKVERASPAPKVKRAPPTPNGERAPPTPKVERGDD
jgi:hypothetical protein